MDAGVDEVPYDGLLTHPPDLVVVDVDNPEGHLQLVAAVARFSRRKSKSGAVSIFKKMSLFVTSPESVASE